MKKKKCFKCGIEKSINNFYKHDAMSDGHLGKCKDCTKIDVSKRRALNKEYYDDFDRNRYRKDIDRLLASRYDGMRRRVLGLCKRGSTGKCLLTENEFIVWNHTPEVFETFKDIYDLWVASGFQRRLSPSIDRIDNKKGYSIDNIQWITQSENSKKH